MAALPDQLDLRGDDPQHVRRCERAERRKDLIEKVAGKDARERDDYQQRGKHGKKAVIGQLSGEAETVVVDGLFDCSFEENSPAYGAAERDAHGRGAALMAPSLNAARSVPTARTLGIRTWSCPYHNAARKHASLEGHTPLLSPVDTGWAAFGSMHCRTDGADCRGPNTAFQPVRTARIERLSIYRTGCGVEPDDLGWRWWVNG